MLVVVTNVRSWTSRGDKMDEDLDSYEVRFYCENCGHNFCLELDDNMPTPKFCIFCASTVDFREDDELDEDEEDFYL